MNNAWEERRHDHPLEHAKVNEKCPLIGVGVPCVINEHTRTALAGLALEGQCDVVAKTALGQRVLAWE